MRKIGVRIAFLEGDRRREELAAKAGELGFAVKYIDIEHMEPCDAADCEVFFGMIPPEYIGNCPGLKWIHFSFAGVDPYTDPALYPNSRILLTNSAGAYGLTISEHLICTLLMLMRRMPHYMENQARREWKRMGEMRSIYGSTITVLGMGDIGANFARRAKAMGAVIRGVRRHPEKQASDCFDQIFGSDRLTEALTGADVAALCLPGTRETRRILTAEGLAAMKRGSYVLNVGRGTAIDQQALADALERGHIAGAALDVTDPEPLPPTHPLWSAPNLIITPHVSGNMSLSHTCDLIYTQFMENLQRYAAGKPLRHVVDIQAGY